MVLSYDQNTKMLTTKNKQRLFQGERRIVVGDATIENSSKAHIETYDIHSTPCYSYTNIMTSHMQPVSTYI